VLAPFGFAGCSAGIHEKQRGLGRHGYRVYLGMAVIFQDLVERKITILLQGRLAAVFTGMSFPDQNFFYFMALFPGYIKGFVSICLMVNPLTAAIIAVNGEKHPALGVNSTIGAGCRTETAENYRMNNAEAGTGQHGNRQFCGHGQMQGYPVAGFQAAEITQHCSSLIHPGIEFLIGDVLYALIFRVRHKMKCCLVLVLGQVPVKTVIADIELAAYKPFPERGVAGIENGVPFLVPVKQVSILRKTVRKIVQAEPVVN
jgi:hypothetical protein